MGSAGDTIDVSGLANKRYLMILHHAISTGTVVSFERYNADSGSNYAGRFSVNGVSDSTEVNQTEMQDVGITTGLESYQVEYVANLATTEKLSIKSMSDNSSGTGAENAPRRIERVNKWVDTTNPIDQIQNINTDSGDFAIGSETIVLGWDPADTHTTNFWEVLVDVDLSTGENVTIDSGTFTAKKYLWVQFYYPSLGGLASNLQMFFNSDNASFNYAMRNSKNGAADATTVNQNLAQIFPSDINPLFANMFIINNSSNEKLCILHSSAVSADGAGNAPERNEEVIKWANTAEQITRIRLQTNLIQFFGKKSYLKVWGSN